MGKALKERRGGGGNQGNTSKFNDPENGFMFRENTQEMFCYLDHRTTDFKFNIIKDAYVTLGNSHDSVPYLSRHVRQIEQLGFKVEASALDSG